MIQYSETQNKINIQKRSEESVVRSSPSPNNRILSVYPYIQVQEVQRKRLWWGLPPLPSDQCLSTNNLDTRGKSETTVQPLSRHEVKHYTVTSYD